MTTLILEQRSMAVPLLVPLADWPHAPGVSENALATMVPVFLMLIVVVTVWPGIMPRLAPYLSIVMQVALLVEIPAASLLQVTVPAALVSCITRVPEPAVSTVFWMEALKAEKVGDIPKASTSDDTPPARTSGRESLRFFEEVSDLGMLTPWLSPGRPLG